MIEYRKATVEDIKELVDLRIEFLKEANNEYNIDTEIQIEIENLLYKYFKNSLGNNSFIAWLALSEGKIVATSGLCFYNIPPLFKIIDGDMKTMSGNVAYIMNMYTVPEYRKKGIATKLFEKILNEAKSLGYRKISLHATEMGQKLYKKYGFKVDNSEMVLHV